MVKKTNKIAKIDCDKRPSLMEPLVLSSNSRYRQELSELVFDLTKKSAGFRRSLPIGVMNALAQLVRAMNCYYSNLIEGHDTHPIDIERALHGDYSKDKNKRDLQLEAKAHIFVQRWLDEGGLRGKVYTRAGILEIHKLFCESLPDDLLFVEDPKSHKKVKVIPGEFRNRDVAIGNHVAISPGALPRFLAKFEDVYSGRGAAETILAVAAAHHRLLWIHPFLDGNGRVARLMSHAVMLEKLDTGGVWSVARGLARRDNDYKRLLIACDQGRKNNLDGRGNLSEEALASFTRFFLEVCIDQVEFMENLIEPNRLRKRILFWTEEEINAGTLPQHSQVVLESILFRGELPRGDVAELIGVGDRQGRRIVASLIEKGVLVSEDMRSPLRLSFPATLASRWMPGLFPDKQI
jgi:Fic family protein